MDITVDAVLAMAPDESSVKAARGLASPGKWQSLGADEAAAWGLCQGSGSKPYQVKVDLSGPACSCSCPSRKIPCKHALALLLLLAQQKAVFTEGERPAWVSEWLEGRQQRAARKEEGQARKKHALPSPKKEAARLARMATGLEELSRWMGDQVRCGLSSLSGQYGEWGRLAARMVDAQAPGMAARLLALEGVVDNGQDWPGRLLGSLGELQLLVDAFSRMDSLSPEEKADVRAALGLAADKESVLSGEERVSEVWTVIGITFEEEDKLWRRRVWLYGNASGRIALLLDFSHKSRTFEPVFTPGGSVRMTLAFYPGASPLRAVVADAPVQEPGGALPSFTLEEAFSSMARAVAANPWQLPLPLFFSGAKLFCEEERWYLLAGEDRALPLVMSDGEAWELLARSGGNPLTVCGEWDGEVLRLAGAFVQTQSCEQGGCHGCQA
ncbi:SWIM zinc finger family protein [Mailhella massiliensis]|uniref:SWIM zinc finger domain-containing protein n=1 Tax=Mailhella massiliensis TaxID=1903261 RepID=A0A921DSQ6_9BACT|nr:SWIM zinc finger family protein [Mailhella massiliensis]HJD97187.1 SWIM zinc finger domain-containing protein [Mailhella massiliensis]